MVQKVLKIGEVHVHSGIKELMRDEMKSLSNPIYTIFLRKVNSSALECYIESKIQNVIITV